MSGFGTFEDSPIRSDPYSERLQAWSYEEVRGHVAYLDQVPILRKLDPRWMMQRRSAGKVMEQKRVELSDLLIGLGETVFAHDR